MIEKNNLDDRIIDVNTIDQKENFELSLITIPLTPESLIRVLEPAPKM